MKTKKKKKKKNKSKLQEWKKFGYLNRSRLYCRFVLSGDRDWVLCLNPPPSIWFILYKREQNKNCVNSPQIDEDGREARRGIIKWEDEKDEDGTRETRMGNKTGQRGGKNDDDDGGKIPLPKTWCNDPRAPLWNTFLPKPILVNSPRYAGQIARKCNNLLYLSLIRLTLSRHDCVYVCAVKTMATKKNEHFICIIFLNINQCHCLVQM